MTNSHATLHKDAADRLRAVRLGVRDALREHALLGHPVCVWRDEKVVWLTLAEILEELRRTEPADGTPNGTAQESHD